MFITLFQKAVLLIHQFCTIVPASDSKLVEKCCKLIVNLITLQYVNIEGRTLSFAIEWAIQVLKQSDPANVAALKCLESLIRDNVHHLHEVRNRVMFYFSYYVIFFVVITRSNRSHWDSNKTSYQQFFARSSVMGCQMFRSHNVLKGRTSC